VPQSWCGDTKKWLRSRRKPGPTMFYLVRIMRLWIA
jgi:hypothetical protein